MEIGLWTMNRIDQVENNSCGSWNHRKIERVKDYLILGIFGAWSNTFNSG